MERPWSGECVYRFSFLFFSFFCLLVLFEEKAVFPEGVGKYLQLTHSQRAQEKDDIDAAIRASLRTAGEESVGSFVDDSSDKSEAGDESPEPSKPPSLGRGDAAVDFDAVIGEGNEGEAKLI